MQVENPNYFDDGGWDDGYGGYHGYHQPPYITAYYTAAVREDYAYGADGTLASVRIAESQASDNHDGTVSVTGPAATGALKATYSHDLLGRLTRQQDWLYDGSGVAFDRTVAYDNASHVTSETDVSRQGSDTYTSYVSNYYGSGSSYALGAVVSSSSSNYKNGGYQNYSTTTTSYAWYEGAVRRRRASPEPPRAPASGPVYARHMGGQDNGPGTGEELTSALIGSRLDAMAPLPRAVFLLRHLDGLAVAAIALRLGMAPDDVERYLAAAMNALIWG